MRLQVAAKRPLLPVLTTVLCECDKTRYDEAGGHAAVIALAPSNPFTALSTRQVNSSYY